MTHSLSVPEIDLVDFSLVDFLFVLFVDFVIVLVGFGLVPVVGFGVVPDFAGDFGVDFVVVSDFVPGYALVHHYQSC